MRRFWESTEQKGMDDQILFEVKNDSEECLRLLRPLWSKSWRFGVNGLEVGLGLGRKLCCFLCEWICKW